ncbi:unnamed protein product [Oppiella nova]|uniref:Uncharacterized protein n=1 Tax=Oppiella nova TaxID=334625 RepID=A0A7R9QJH4_9ACAR|nr:unnamed protein product [Oppiella nova]CAG2166953.1 unnamed protein product [Oppiella nova]
MAQCHRPWSDVVDILITNRKQELSVACDSSAFITANECSQLYPDMTTNSTDTTISPVKEIPIDMPNNKPSEWTTEANIPERNPLDSPYMDNTNHSLDSYPTYHSGDNSIEPKIESYTSDSYDISFGTSVAIGMALYLLLIHL